jgi:hypothetical protein
MSSLTKYPNLQKLSLYLRDYSFTAESARALRTGAARLGNLRWVYIRNHFPVCSGVLFEKIRDLREMVKEVGEGEVVGLEWE